MNGKGRALLLEGHAGMGKTRLHEAALDDARSRGMRVLRAAGAELEQNVAFGVAGQLIRALLSDLPPAGRRAFLAEAPERVRSLAGAREDLLDPGDAGDLTMSHGLFTMMAGAAEARATLLAIDDLHWCDVASLEFVLYVLHRLDELPVVLVMTRRPGVGAAEAADAFDRIASHPRVQLESLTGLGVEAVQELAREALGERADPAVVEASIEVTNGNPFYVHELLVALADEDSLRGAALTRRARALAPDAVIRSLRVRVGRLGPAAAALARAIAVLGDDVPLRRAAALAELPIDAATAAADALAGVEMVLAREPLRFVHPLVQHAVEQDIPLFERASRHLDAARLLDADGEDAERVAAHLLLGHAGGDPWVVERLRAAAREARAAQPAARYLERALQEPPTVSCVPRCSPSWAARRPRSAARRPPSISLRPPPRRLTRAGARSSGSSSDGRSTPSRSTRTRPRAYDAALQELPPAPEDPDELELRDQLEASFISTASIVPDLQPLALERAARVVEHADKGPRTQGQRMLLAQAALHATTTGESAHNAIELTERAWDGGRMLSDANPSGSGGGWSRRPSCSTASSRAPSRWPRRRSRRHAGTPGRWRSPPPAMSAACRCCGRAGSPTRSPTSSSPATRVATDGSNSPARPPRIIRCA